MLCFAFRVLENACKDDEELRGVLGDSIGNPELMRKRVEDRVRRKGRDFQKSKTGSVLAFKVTFRKYTNILAFHQFLCVYQNPFSISSAFPLAASIQLIHISGLNCMDHHQIGMLI